MKPRSIKPMDNQPMVSVIIPVFNGAAYIQGAIESVLNQTSKDVEIIVVDDGSTDETARLLGPWINNGAIRYVHQANKGSMVARNVGIRMAKGKFIKFLDSDDFLYPRQLELQVQHLENKPDFVISATDYEFEYEDKTRQQVKMNLGHGSQLARIIEDNLGPIHCFLVRRKVIEKVAGFDESLSSCQDTDQFPTFLVGCVVQV
jgi:glycosyltransferase involved in cell wall biosynthesis